MYKKVLFILKKKYSECGFTANDASKIDEGISTQDLFWCPIA